ncbi:MAG: hypothetical protein QOK11_1042 [Pseudonocardiales bacterium]|nr:hypothetical protein [Pseudonocardiales bacterium]
MASCFGGLAAFIVALGFVPLFFSEDGEGTWVDVGLAVVVVGSAGLFFGPLVLQIREGLLAMRRGASPTRFVLAATVGFCAGATAAFMLAIIGLEVSRAIRSEQTHWADIPGAAAFFGPWGYAAISAGVVVGVTEFVQRTRRRRARRSAVTPQNGNPSSSAAGSSSSKVNP